MRNKIYDIEIEKADMQATYEKEKALWEGKINFLEQQRE